MTASTFIPQRHQALRCPTSGGLDALDMLRQRLETQHHDLRDAFRIIDRDSSGSLSRDEIEAALLRYDIPVRHIDVFMRKLDTNCDGLVSFAEFAAALSPRVDAFTARTQTDRYVTNQHVVVPRMAGGQVLTNDNLPQRCTGGELRLDAELMTLPQARGMATSKQLEDYSSTLSTIIYTKYGKFRDAFRSVDVNKDGRLSEEEFKRAVRMYNLPIPEAHIEQIFRQLCDRNGDGQVDYLEFALALKRKDALGN